MTWHSTTVKARFLDKLETAMGPCAGCRRCRPAEPARHESIISQNMQQGITV